MYFVTFSFITQSILNFFLMFVNSIHKKNRSAQTKSS